MPTDGWPDTRDFPYIALIRIRYVHELDILTIRQVQRAVVATTPAEVSREFVAETNRIALEQVDAKPQELTAAARGTALSAFTPDGWCGTSWWLEFLEWLRRHVGPVPVPDPGPDPVYLGAAVALTIMGARDLVAAAASPAVAEQVSSALGRLAEQAGRSAAQTR